MAQDQLKGTNIFNWNKTPFTAVYLQQSNALTNNMIRTLDTTKQLTINALEAVGNNLETYNNIVKVVL